MKYIYKRHQYNQIDKLNETMMDSDKIDVEFGDTLIGGTLHRLLGFFRSKVKQGQISIYAKQLDRLLASIVMDKVIEEATGKESSEKESEDIIDGKESDKGEDTQTGVKKIVASQLLLSAVNSYEQGNEDEATEKVDDIPEEIALMLPKSSQEAIKALQSRSVDQEEEDQEEEDQEEEDQEEVKEIEGEGVKAIEDGGTRKSVLKVIQKYENMYKEAIEHCKKCNLSEDDRIQKVLNRIKGGIETMKKYVDEGKYNDVEGLFEETKSFFEMVYKMCRDCETDGSKVEEAATILLEKMEAIFEKEVSSEREEGQDVDTTNILSQRGFNRVRKDIEKASKKWKITKEQLHEINKVAEEKVKVEEITGRQAKSLMSILTKAKDALLHTKPYDEIRKKQKRWYDKLTGGRAINRKGYATWTKKVNEIVAYYKDQLPEKVMTVITDSLDKTNMANDYVTLNQEFLGINKRGTKVRSGFNSSSDNKLDDKNFVTGYKVGDTVKYQQTSGKINSGTVKEIRKNDVDIETKTGIHTILKKRIKEVNKK